MPQFSIVIPVHNAEKTLPRCIASLKRQTVSDYEVLLIENGSCDGSRQLCKAYSEEDDRICFLSCEGGNGPSNARNMGLDNASGKWIAFVDSDDFVECNYLECLENTFADNDADAVFMGYSLIDSAGKVVGQKLPGVADTENLYKTVFELSKQDMFGYTWIKAFKREVIGGKRFRTDMNLFEDEVFTCEVLRICKSLAMVEQPIYNYVIGNPGSLVGRVHQDYCCKREQVYLAWKELLKPCECSVNILEHHANAAVNTCRYYGFERPVDVNNFFKDLAGCTFFNECTIEDKFVRYIKDEQLRKIKWVRAKYRLKVSISKLLRG